MTLEFYKTKEAKQAVERLQKLEYRKQNRWRQNKFWAFTICLVMVGNAFASNISWWNPIVLVLCYYVYLLERGLHNLYEWETIRRAKNRVMLLSAAGDISQPDPVLLAYWRSVVKKSGGDPDDESFSPQRHTAAFSLVTELDQKKNDDLTSPENKKKLQDKMYSLISDVVAPQVELAEEEKKHAALAAQAEALAAARERKQQLENHNNNIEAMLAQINELQSTTFHNN